jgi:sugar phosphate permease
VASIGSVLLGIAPSAAWALAGRALVGVGVAMLFVPTMKILAEWFRVDEFAVMTGILMAVGGLGSLIAAAPLAWLSVWIGWRLSFVVVGAFTLVLAALVWMVVRDRPADLGWPSPAEHLQSKVEPIALREGMRRVVGCRAFWPLAVWFFFNCAVFFSFGGLWGGPYLIQVHQMSKDQAASVLSMLAVGMMVGSPLLSYLSNSIFRARKPVLVLSSLITAGITALLAFRTAVARSARGDVFRAGALLGAIVVIGFTPTRTFGSNGGTATGLVNLFHLPAEPCSNRSGYLLEGQGRVDEPSSGRLPANVSALFVCS